MLLKSYAILQILISVIYTNGYDSYCEQPETVFKINCKALRTESYSFNDFFPISKNNGGEIKLVFYVKGERDAHILLSPTPNLPTSKEQEKVYEIVLGAAQNTYSAIRKQRGVANVQVHNEVNITSPDEWRKFWIRISSDGIIRVGKSRENIAFLNWTDPNPFPINYYSFSSWHDNDIYWFHQCTNQTEDPIIRYQEEELKSHLFSNYDKVNRPTQANANSTQITIQSSYVDLNTANGIFELRGTIFIDWSDKRLTWNPNEQHGLDSLEIEPNSIWWPVIKLTNQVFVHDYFLGFGKTTVSSNGVIKHEASSNIQSRCQISTNSQLLDTYNCNLNFTTDFHTNFTFSQDVISPWILIKTQSMYSLEKNETKPFMENVSINVTLQKNISQPTSCSEFPTDSSSEEKLICQLFSNYNSSIFPNTTSQDHFHEIQFKMFYADISDISGIFQIVGEVEGKWNDHRLTWEPSEYNYTYVLQIENNFHQIWKPKFKLVNGAFFEDTFLFDSDHIASLVITYAGAVTLRMRSINIQAECQVTVKSRPWNNHTCQLHFKSDAPKFDIKYEEFDQETTAVTNARAYYIVSPWMVHEFREVKRINGSLESSDNSIFIDVELHRDMDDFESTRCNSFANSYEEELKCHLYSKVGRLVPSEAFLNGPQLDMTISYVDLNIENELFQMKGQLVLKWAHEKMAWDPKKFGDLFVLKIEEDTVWKPALILKNEVFEEYIKIDLEFLGSGNFRNSSNDEYFGAGHLEVTSNGALTWTLPMNIDTRCNMTLNSWPWDPQTCQLNFTTNTAKMHSRINDSSQMKSRSGTMSLWKITEIFKANNTSFQFRLMVTLENKSNSLQVVLCSTLTGLSSVMLSSFLISPTNRNKLPSKLLSLLLLVIFLAIMMTSIPHFTTQAPNFLIGFVMLLSIVGTSSCITAYLVRLARKSHSYNPSLNVRFTSTEENEGENYAMKTALIQGVPLIDDKTTDEASAAEKSQHNWLKVAMVVELSSFAICSIVVVFLITSLMN